MKVVTLLSGGLDSSVLLYKFVSGGYEVFPLVVNYGQRHSRELDSADKISIKAGLGTPERVVLFAGTILKGSSQTEKGIEVPHGHYADDNMAVTIVPNRNMILISLAAAYAYSIGAAGVAIAAHAGDHTVYPDCRPEFIAAAGLCVSLATGGKVELSAPFKNVYKAGIVREGHLYNCPMHLTWSCYEGGTRHCGLCATCIERREAFYIAGVEDETSYSVPLEESFKVGGICIQ